jgi:hypothetical protein
MTQAQTAAPQGYVLDATEGERLIHFRDAGNIFIKAGPATAPTISPWGPSSCRPVGHSGPPTLSDGRSFLRSGRQWNFHTERCPAPF